MVKVKKAATVKKTKNEEASVNEAENSEVENTNEESSQENGEVDVSIKKKGRGKTSKTEDAVSDNDAKDDEVAVIENGDENTVEKPPPAKKTKPAKKSVAKPASEPSRKSSRPSKPVTKEGTEEAEEKSKAGHREKKAKKRSSSKSPVKGAKKAKTKKEEDYEVEEVVGMRVKNGKKEFKIRWKGYKASDDSWEPQKHLSCQDLIEKYLAEHKDEVEAEEKKTPAKTKTPAKSEGRKKKTK